MDKISAVIIEDEKRAQIYLNGMLAKVAPQIEILEICYDLPSGVLAIRKKHPDLVFLDIEMPKYSGLEIVNFFNEDEINFSIVFTTAYNQYAIQAFKTSAIDYLIKPIDANELKNCIERYSKTRKIKYNEIATINKEFSGEAKIAIPDGNTLVMISPEEILYLQADNSYTKIYLTSDKKMITSRFLKNFEESLQKNPLFFRCHKSYIINIQHVSAYSKSDGGTVFLKNKIEIPVSADKSEELLKLFVKVNR